MTSPYKDDVAHFCVTFTRAIMAWNVAEEAARYLLLALVKAGPGGEALVVHLQNPSLLDALAAVVSVRTGELYPDADLEVEHVSHFIEGMDILRAYRNFYVHAIKAMGKKPKTRRDGDTEDDFVGLLTSTEGKKRISFINQYVTSKELTAFMRHVDGLRRYGRDLQTTLGNRNALRAFLHPPAKPLASLEKPVWPERLKKTRSFLTGQSPLAESPRP